MLEFRGAGRRARRQEGEGRLREGLVEAARAAARTRTSYLSAQYHRIAARRGAKWAGVAVAHSLIVILHHMLRQGTSYKDLGADQRSRHYLPGRIWKITPQGDTEGSKKPGRLLLPGEGTGWELGPVRGLAGRLPPPDGLTDQLVSQRYGPSGSVTSRSARCRRWASPLSVASTSRRERTRRAKKS